MTEREKIQQDDRITQLIDQLVEAAEQFGYAESRMRRVRVEAAKDALHEYIAEIRVQGAGE